MSNKASRSALSKSIIDKVETSGVALYENDHIRSILGKFAVRGIKGGGSFKAACLRELTGLE